jgi:hypothetical protein
MISTPEASSDINPAQEESSFAKEFSEKLASFATPEEKIAYGLEFMRGSISQEGSPRFRQFWEPRRLILLYFKQNLGAAIRSKLWNEYVELTVEARKLKEILEEQSAFAIEQIDLAIQAIEADVQNFATGLEAASEIVLPEECRTIRQRIEVYNKIQKELNLLNASAGKLSSLRKEIIKTDMRIRFKTKFFKRLSDLGDKVFPRRKELIEQVSSEFEKDIELFIANHFKTQEVTGAPYYALREEIKALQGAAKIFTLNSAVFTRTRLLLSECWDKVKVLEKEHKKEVLERKQASSEKVQAVKGKIEELKARSAEMSLDDLNAEIYAISEEMRSSGLHREDVRLLKDALFELRAPHLAAQEEKIKEREAIEKEKLRQKREAINAVKEKVTALCKQAEKIELEALKESLTSVTQEIEALNLSKMEKQQLERSLRSVKDQIVEKQESVLLNLSDDDKKTLENLKTVLLQKKQRRSEIKDQLEVYRKTLGGSGLDFEKAIHVQELVEQEKERLAKADAGIDEIEAKIAELEG